MSYFCMHVFVIPSADKCRLREEVMKQPVMVGQYGEKIPCRARGRLHGWLGLNLWGPAYLLLKYMMMNSTMRPRRVTRATLTQLMGYSPAILPVEPFTVTW